MKLTDRFDEDVIEYKGITIKLRLAFDVVLRSFELLRDDTFSEAEKAFIMMEMFTVNTEAIELLTIYERSKLINIIYNDFIDFDKKQEDESEDKFVQGSAPPKKLYDFDKDAKYIYASFLFDYNIDLYEQQGRLHWVKFIHLLNNLSDKSKFKEVIGIRAAEIPAPNKYNKEERERIIKLKKIYSLENKETAADLDAKFEQLAHMLRPRGGEKHVRWTHSN